MTDQTPTQPPGWYHAQGDPPGTQRYWDGTQWQGGPQPTGQQFNAGAGGGLDLAEAGNRFLARLLDTIGYLVVNFVVAIPFGVGAVLSGSGDVSFVSSLIVGLVGLAILFVNEVILTTNNGGTIGKKVLGMKVVNADGSAIDQPVAIRRASPYIGLSVLGLIPILGVIGGFITLILAIVGLIMLFTDDERRLPWDRIADTRVVKA